VGERAHGLASPASGPCDQIRSTATARPLGSKRAKAASPHASAHSQRTPARRAARRKEPMNPPDILGDDVTASTFLCTISKQSLPLFLRLGSQIAAPQYPPRPD
jgi:hypothetical protein